MNRMISSAGVTILAAAFAVTGPIRAAAAAAPSEVPAALRRMSQELLDAVAPGEVAVWQRYLDDRFVHLDENGVIRDKAALLRELKPLPPGLVGRIEIDKFEATVHGDTAVVVYEIQEYLDYHGQPIRSRFRTFDTWLATASGWRLIGEHTAAVLKDPPVVALTQPELCAYEGNYSLTAAIKTTIRCTKEGLRSERSDRPPAEYRAELRDVFFVPGQQRTRRIFTRDASGRVDGFVDRREGEDIRWTKELEEAP